MKKYTQAEFDSFETIDGIRQCPTGDYSNVKSFGEWCSFGECCKIENGKKLKSLLKFEGFGSEKRCTYFFLITDNSIYVRCGCFAGNIDEFRAKVKETHGDSFFAEGYLKIAELAEWQFGQERSEPCEKESEETV